MHPPKIDQKCRFPSDETLMGNFNNGNGLIDPKSVSQNKKLILKVFEINKMWVKPFFFRPPSNSQPKNSFLARTVSFFGGFFRERYQIAQEDLPFEIRHVPNVSETSPLYSPPLILGWIVINMIVLIIVHDYPLELQVSYESWKQALQIFSLYLAYLFKVWWESSPRPFNMLLLNCI